MSDSPADNDELPSRPSKTSLKKAMHEYQQLGLALAELSPALLEDVDLDERLREELDGLRNMHAHSARKRQIKFVGQLLSATDTAPLRAILNGQRADRAQSANALHEAETWRDRLLADDDALGEWLRHFPDSDTKPFRALVKNAGIEREAAEAAARRGEARRKGRHYRELFRAVRTALNQAGSVASDDGSNRRGQRK